MFLSSSVFHPLTIGTLAHDVAILGFFKYIGHASSSPGLYKAHMMKHLSLMGASVLLFGCGIIGAPLDDIGYGNWA